MLRLFTNTIKANSTENFALRGNYVRVKSALITFNFTTQNGDDFDLAEGEEASIYEFDVLRIKNDTGADQTISYYIGLGNVGVGSAKVGGNVSVNNFPAFPTSYSINNFQEDYLTYGAAFFSNALLAANGNVNVFTPAANVNGAIVKALSFNSYNAGGAGNSSVGFIAHTGAPATIADGVKLLTPAGGSIVNASQYMHGNELMRSVFLPAGVGLYFLSTIAETYSAKKALYTLL